MGNIILVMRIASISQSGYTSDGKRWDEVTIANDNGGEIGKVQVQLSGNLKSHDEVLRDAGFSPFRWDFELHHEATIPIGKLFFNGHNAPLTVIPNVDEMEPHTELGASRYRHYYIESRYLDALLLNKGADTLVVYLHGATARSNTVLPRFERLATLSSENVSSMFFSDPTLHLHPKMQLGWYTGWDGVNVQDNIAQWIQRTARAIGARKIIISGASGGGFAALQISALIPNSICVTFNPSVQIHRYYTNGDPGTRGAQRNYIRWVHPEVADGNIDSMDLDPDWTTELGDEVSAIRRYSEPVENWVLFVQNVNDWHVEQHYWPFLGACGRGDNLHRVKVLEYKGGHGHFAPQLEQYMAGLKGAQEWAAKLDERN